MEVKAKIAEMVAYIITMWTLRALEKSWSHRSLLKVRVKIQDF